MKMGKYRPKLRASRQKPISSSRVWAGSPYFDRQPTTVERYADLDKMNQENPEKKNPISIVGPLFTQTQASTFYASREWVQLKAVVYQKYGHICMACGETEGFMRVDHIKPLRRHWELRLSFNNMQVLCVNCNKDKGNWAETDFRPQAKYIRKCRKQKKLSYEEELDAYMRQKVNLALRRT